MTLNKIVYVESKIINNLNTNYILSKLKPALVIEIENYKEILNQPNSNWIFEKKHQKIVLAQKTSDFIYKASTLPCNYKRLNYYYNLLAINCFYMCDYCYLQGMYNNPHIVMFVNNRDFIEQTKKLVEERSGIYLAISYDTDIVLLENYYPYCTEWIDFANKTNGLEIEIRTKSSNLSFIHNFKAPVTNTIISFTILPEEIKKNFESISSPISSRITALQETIELGWKVVLCLDPIIKIENYKSIYLEFLSSLFRQINYKALYGVNVGLFRMNHKFFKRIQKTKKNSELYCYNYYKYADIISYNPKETEELLNPILQFIEEHKISNVFVHKP